MTRQDLLAMVHALPEQAAIDDFIAELPFRAKVDERLADADRGDTVSHEETVAHLHKLRLKLLAGFQAQEQVRTDARVRGPAMDDWKLPWEGGCRCGRVRFRITAPPLLTTACHCTGCQRMTGSAFSLSVGVPSDAFELLQGEPVRGGVQEENDHRHCPFCKSWLFTRPEAMDFVNVRATMLDDPSWVVPYVETWAGEKLPWVSTPAVHSFESLPELSAWQGLIAEFAAKGSRPSR